MSACVPGAKQRATSSGSDHLPHPRPHASLSVTGRSISRSQLLSGVSAQLSPSSSLSQPMSSLPTRSTLDMTHQSFASPFSSGSAANRESFSGHSQAAAGLGTGSEQSHRKATHAGPTRDFSSLGLTLRDGSEGLRSCPTSQSSFSTLLPPQWPVLSSAAQPMEPAFASLLDPLVPPDLPLDVLDWDPLADIPCRENPLWTGGSASSGNLIPAWQGPRGSIGSNMSEVGQITDDGQNQLQMARPGQGIHEESAQAETEPLWQATALPSASTAAATQAHSSTPGLSEKVYEAALMPCFDEAHVLEDLYLNTPGFTSMLEELASNDSMQQDR